ncbi:hypothetical protein PAPHI01_0068 [Pancytospora philotis]|nr:hypothetical protein PAPHI01_0068 [Pancytospora philotis]
MGRCMARDLFEFNYPLLPQDEIAFETKVKKRLRDISYNFREEREIARYSDRYVFSIPHSKIMETVDMELLSPELVRMYGAGHGRRAEEIQADVDENSSERQEGSAEEDGSLGGGDDYSEYYNDEEELVADKDGGGEETY